MPLHLYSKSVVDIIFGEGPLGFIIGKDDDDYSLLKTFDTKEDGTRLPLEVGVDPCISFRVAAPSTRATILSRSTANRLYF